MNTMSKRETRSAKNRVWYEANKGKVLEQHRRYKVTAKGVWTQLKSHKAKGPHSFAISEEEFIRWWNSTPKRCHYCGSTDEDQARLSAALGLQRRSNRLQIDRMDSTRGYSLDNIALACRICNEHKKDFFSEQQFIEIAERYLKPKFRLILEATPT